MKLLEDAMKPVINPAKVAPSTSLDSRLHVVLGRPGRHGFLCLLRIVRPHPWRFVGVGGRSCSIIAYSFPARHVLDMGDQADDCHDD
jgi:hypothetical protein